MNFIHKVLGLTCEKCPICRYARANSDGLVYKLLDHPIHGSHCPAWQGYRKLEDDRNVEKREQDMAVPARENTESAVPVISPRPPRITGSTILRTLSSLSRSSRLI